MIDGDMMVYRMNQSIQNCVIVLLSLLTTAQSVSPQTEFVEKTEFSELITVLSNRFRNILTEFHEIRDGDINFFLVTREDQHVVQLNNSNLDLVKPGRLTNFIIGGWIQNFRGDAMYSDMARAYLRKGDYNIIIVDAHKIAFLPVEVAMSYAQPAGIVVGKFVVKLLQQVKVSLNKVTIIAHSLGGNVAGFAGREVIKLTGSKIARIIGLDSSHFPFDPLNKDDAQVVQLIHTTATAGRTKASGTVDFFPNGGDYNVQPGCTLYPEKPLKNLTDAVSFYFCSHHKSYEYFILTLNSTVEGVKCKSYNSFQEGKCRDSHKAIFGDNYVPGPQGSYYLYLNCSDSSCVSSYT